MSPLRSPRDTRRTFPRYLRAVSIRRWRDIGGVHFEIGDDLALVGKDASTIGSASISAGIFTRATPHESRYLCACSAGKRRVDNTFRLSDRGNPQ